MVVNMQLKRSESAWGPDYKLTFDSCSFAVIQDYRASLSVPRRTGVPTNGVVMHEYHNNYDFIRITHFLKHTATIIGYTHIPLALCKADFQRNLYWVLATRLLV